MCDSITQKHHGLTWIHIRAFSVIEPHPTINPLRPTFSSRWQVLIGYVSSHGPRLPRESVGLDNIPADSRNHIPSARYGVAMQTERLSRTRGCQVSSLVDKRFTSNNTVLCILDNGFVIYLWPRKPVSLLHTNPNRSR